MKFIFAPDISMSLSTVSYSIASSILEKVGSLQYLSELCSPNSKEKTHSTHQITTEIGAIEIVCDKELNYSIVILSAQSVMDCS